MIQSRQVTVPMSTIDTDSTVMLKIFLNSQNILQKSEFDRELVMILNLAVLSNYDAI